MMKGIAEYFGMEGEDAREQFTSGHLIKDPPVEPEDIGRAVLWLVSDESRCITGNMITVDGGWTAAAP
jgi:NAD(P)-dependent dehydrogenase (short-subunit alcohol dehydrogenase family)